MEASKGLLDGIIVIDLTRVLAGPYATMMLGDLGAEIIKVEAPGKGDDTRHWGPPFTESGESSYFLSANRNKRSISLNLKSENGKKVLSDLIRKADVLIENFKVGTLEKMGFDYDKLQQLRPGLIYCTITGFGYSGPYKDLPGYDFIVQALGGMMAITGPADGEPTRVGVAITDLMTGIFASNAIMAALVGRNQGKNQGQRIDMSLLDTQIASLAYVANNYLISGTEPVRFGNGHPSIVPYQSFKTNDSYIAFAVGNDSQWEKFCIGINRADLQIDPDYRKNTDRVQNRDVLIPILEEIFLSKSTPEWLQLCKNIGIPAAPINKISEVFNDPQVLARERVIEYNHPTAGKIPLIASPMNIPTQPATIRYPPPLLGEHNEEILKNFLGYDENQYNMLLGDGLV